MKSLKFKISLGPADITTCALQQASEGSSGDWC